MIIGMLGWIGCGKGTAAKYFKERDFVNESFAGPLKDATASVFGWPRHLLEGDTEESREFRERPCSFWGPELGRVGFSPRVALQEVGTEVFRDSFYQNIWVAALRKRLQEHKANGTDVIISDVRFKNEVAMLHDEGAILCWIKRGNNPEWYAHAFEANVNGNTRHEEVMKSQYHYVHQSEWDWVGCPMDHIIFNENTLENFHNNLDLMYIQEVDRLKQLELQSASNV